jgi:uncharacterized protein (TIGR02444 family)
VSESGLWAYALEVYRRPGAETALLEAQDTYGQCVPYLLWALWLAARGRAADVASLAVGAELAQAWQEAAIAPLRALRRRLKLPNPPLPADARARLRDGVQALELQAERSLLETLESSCSPPYGGVEGAEAVLAKAVRAWGGGDVPAKLLARLATLSG